MPYIPPEDRLGLYPDVSRAAASPGELNFQISALAVQYLAEHGLNYEVLNDVLGAIEGAKLEFARRVVAPYEDHKIADNGDVYTDRKDPS